MMRRTAFHPEMPEVRDCFEASRPQGRKWIFLDVRKMRGQRQVLRGQERKTCFEKDRKDGRGESQGAYKGVKEEVI